MLICTPLPVMFLSRLFSINCRSVFMFNARPRCRTTLHMTKFAMRSFLNTIYNNLLPCHSKTCIWRQMMHHTWVLSISTQWTHRTLQCAMCPPRRNSSNISIETRYIRAPHLIALPEYLAYEKWNRILKKFQLVFWASILHLVATLKPFISRCLHEW